MKTWRALRILLVLGPVLMAAACLPAIPAAASSMPGGHGPVWTTAAVHYATVQISVPPVPGGPVSIWWPVAAASVLLSLGAFRLSSAPARSRRRRRQLRRVPR